MRKKISSLTKARCAIEATRGMKTLNKFQINIQISSNFPI